MQLAGLTAFRGHWWAQRSEMGGWQQMGKSLSFPLDFTPGPGVQREQPSLWWAKKKKRLHHSPGSGCKSDCHMGLISCTLFFFSYHWIFIHFNHIQRKFWSPCWETQTMLLLLSVNYKATTELSWINYAPITSVITFNVITKSQTWQALQHSFYLMYLACSLRHSIRGISALDMIVAG